MKLRKTSRLSKRRRAHSKKTRRTYKKKYLKMRGGGINAPEKNDLIMYFIDGKHEVGHEGIIQSVNDEGVLVGFEGYTHARFEWDRWNQFVNNHYTGVPRRKVDVAKKNMNGNFPQIAFINVPEGTTWKSLLPSSKPKKTSSKPKKGKTFFSRFSRKSSTDA